MSTINEPVRKTYREKILNGLFLVISLKKRKEEEQPMRKESHYKYISVNEINILVKISTTFFRRKETTEEDARRSIRMNLF